MAQDNPESLNNPGENALSSPQLLHSQFLSLSMVSMLLFLSIKYIIVL